MSWLKATGLSLLALIAPVQAVMLTVGALIIADFLLGMWAARKRGEAITSAAMRRTVSKMLVYQTVVLMGYFTEVHLLGSLLPVSKLVGGIIGVVELKSVLENSSTILGQDLFRALITKLGSANDRREDGK